MVWRILRICLGFAAAVFSASAMFCIIFAISDWDGLFVSGPNTFSNIFIYAMLIGMNVFLPALVIVILAERYHVVQWYAFIIAGGLAAFCSPVGFYAYLLVDRGSMHPTLMIRLAAVGAGAGIVYWLVAGRFAGNWRGRIGEKPISPESRES